MSLQIRVKHALGERVVDLPDRTLDEPVVVGRGSNADVQVPSVTVAPKHCALFIHEGHWVVQDLGTGTTLINGQPVEGAAMLQIGDRIQVGTDAGAPQIEVDPAAAAEGRSGYAGSGLPHLGGAAAAGGYAAAGYGQPSTGYGQPGYAPQQMPPQYGSQQYAGQQPYAAPGYAAAGYGAAVATEDEQPTGDEISFAPTTSSYSSYKRRPTSSGNGGMVAVMIVAVVLIGGVVAFVIYRENNKPKVVQAPPEVKVIKAPAPKGLFVEGPGSSDTTLDKVGKPGNQPAAPSGVKPAGAATIDPRTQAPGGDTSPGTSQPPRPLDSATVGRGEQPKTTEPNKTPATPSGGGDEPGMDPVRPPAGTAEPGMDPVRPPAGAEPGMDPIRKPDAPAPSTPDAENPDPSMTASWEGIKQLAEMPGKESYAVLRFEDFRRLNPGKYDKELDEFIDRKMDRIWWERIDQLFTQIDTLKQTMKETQLKIFDENNPQVKEEMIKSMKTSQTDLEDATKMLRDTMGYGEPNPPNLASSSELAALAQKRDKLKYEGWKKSTIYYIKNNQGRLQWMNQ